MSQNLDLNLTYKAILRAAREKRFISYGELAKANNAEWQKVRYQMNTHLGELVALAADQKWPMPTAIVVNQANVETGRLDGTARDGFVKAAKEFGFDVSNPKRFVEEQQQAMFDWGQNAPDELEIGAKDRVQTHSKVWVEKTIVRGRTDRQEGEHRLGEALWSPQTARNGGDLYANMRKVAPGDTILHLTDNLGITGISEAVQVVDDSFMGVPGTEWGNQPSYRIQLKGFRELSPILSRNDFFKDSSIGEGLRAILDGPDGKGLFYNRKLELNQGAYLSYAPPALVTLLNKAYLKVARRKLLDAPDVEIDISKKTQSVSAPSLNTIFYGPPGTGKTFVTARRAVEICDGGFDGNAEDLRVRYSQLVAENRIEFVTFHQTYGYEEFVEGLRPETGSGENNDAESAGFRLVPVDGVLKRIAERARRLPATSGNGFDPSGRKVFKVSLGRSTSPEDDYIRDECLDGGYILLGYGGDLDWSETNTWNEIAEKWRAQPGTEDASGNDPNIVQTWQIRAAMSEGDIVVASKGLRRIQAIGIVTGPYEYAPRDVDSYSQKRRLEWLWKDDSDEGMDVSDIYKNQLSQVSIYQMADEKIIWDGLLPYLQPRVEAAPQPPHVLIIDEINRANISKVMGELITLLEEDKRSGAANEVSVTLPHSKKHFTLPRNLYIIGTMNTADRSIALLDTALRRRFQFEEMPPDTNMLSVVDGVDVSTVLAAINSRLEWFLGPDQLIGHAWFMKAKTLAELDEIMANKIIPLLKEYFHEDFDRVRAVLGGGDAFLKREKVPVPPGIDDYGEERWRFVDVYRQNQSYGRSAYDELLQAVGSGASE